MDEMQRPPWWDDEDEPIRTIHDIRPLVRVVFWFWVAVLALAGGILWVIR
jgi:hypothetical protein